MSRVYTDHAVFQVGPQGARVTETYGISFAELATRMDVALMGGETLPG